MPFVRKKSYAEDIGDAYGEYDSTFTSDSGEVRAELFRQGGSLVAYVSFTDGKQIRDITDNYIVALRQHAADVGYDGRLRIMYSEN